ncbi:hypothetical protein [Streptomyces zhihengii]|uniref:Uncharacterized protein n=1 Tax=Streptomyces zhihengii TaxID=1818004 RepID=A0ABS2V492_9ACTN|nr:hypothetical protein [Streptomyces zhihengii]MBM9624294.1 hypothetical protein [Streptomyces zhihengii]
MPNATVVVRTACPPGPHVREGAQLGMAAPSEGTPVALEVGILDGETTFVGTFPSNRQVVDVALPLAQHDPTVPHGSSRDRRGPLGRVVKR